MCRQKTTHSQKALVLVLVLLLARRFPVLTADTPMFVQPAPITISYTVVGLLVYLVLCALGEVASGPPIPATVAGHAIRFCDPALGFTLCWM